MHTSIPCQQRHELGIIGEIPVEVAEEEGDSVKEEVLQRRGLVALFFEGAAGAGRRRQLDVQLSRVPVDTSVGLGRLVDGAVRHGLDVRVVTLVIYRDVMY